MRIFSNFVEAVDEVERELLEMGHIVQSHSYQNVVTEGNKDFETCELMGYSFMVTGLSLEKIKNLVIYKNLSQEWIDEEFRERIEGQKLNPGKAWKIRQGVWEKFLNKEGKFDYSYSERVGDQYQIVLNELKVRPNSRQAIIQMFRHDLDHPNFGGKKRIPCTLTYQFLIRNGAINVLYQMRSCDFGLHFCYDLILASMLAISIGKELTYEIGSGIFSFGSLHEFRHSLVKRGIF